MRLELWGPKRHQRAVGFGIVELRRRMRRMSCSAEGEKPHGRRGEAPQGRKDQGIRHLQHMRSGRASSSPAISRPAIYVWASQFSIRWEGTWKGVLKI